MKQRLYLINKETGYVITCKDKNEYATVLTVLGDEWKKCKINLVDPNEPLIENNKVRFSVKMWAQINNIHLVIYHLDRVSNCCRSYFENATCPELEYGLNRILYELKDGVKYSVKELCGGE